MGKKSKISVLESIPESETEEHLLGILVSLFSNLASDTAPRIRLLAKFVEGNYEKVDRLIELRDAAEARLVPVERDIARERQIMMANDEEITDIEIDEWYLRRLSSGLNQLQNADIVLAWLCMEDDGVGGALGS
jgi:beta-catenin-like protein 1